MIQKSIGCEKHFSFEWDLTTFWDICLSLKNYIIQRLERNEMSLSGCNKDFASHFDLFIAAVFFFSKFVEVQQLYRIVFFGSVKKMKTSVRFFSVRLKKWKHPFVCFSVQLKKWKHQFGFFGWVKNIFYLHGLVYNVLRYSWFHKKN